MAILRQHSEIEIRQRFTHYARFAGLVPCYYAGEPGKGCSLAVRNGFPDWLLPAAIHLYQGFMFTVSLVDPDYVPMFPIVITGEIEPRHPAGAQTLEP